MFHSADNLTKQYNICGLKLYNDIYQIFENKIYAPNDMQVINLPSFKITVSLDVILRSLVERYHFVYPEVGDVTVLHEAGKYLHQKGP